MTNYNYVEFLADAIESVLAQTYEQLELVICDDGSTDDSLELINTYAHHDSRIVVISQGNKGQASALNRAFARSKGDVLCLLDSDDVFFNNKVTKVVTAFLTNPSAGLVTHQVLPCSRHSKRLTAEPIPNPLDSGWLFPKAIRQGGLVRLPPCSGMSLRRETAEIVFPVPSELQRGADGFVARGAVLVSEVAVLNEPLALYRLHGDNATGMLAPSAKMVERNLEDAELLTRLLNRFLATFMDRSPKLDHEDLPGYWDYLLLLLTLDPKTFTSKYNQQPQDLVSRIPSRSRRLFWRVILILPRHIRFRTVRFRYSHGRAKRFIKRLLSLRSSKPTSQRTASF